MKKTPDDYNLNAINNMLYDDEIIKNLWVKEKEEAEQFFLKHSDENPNMFTIPSLWIPIVLRLMKEMVIIDPNIRFLQIKEKFGELRVYTETSKAYRETIRQMIQAVSEAINIVTAIQLKISNKV